MASDSGARTTDSELAGPRVGYSRLRRIQLAAAAGLLVASGVGALTGLNDESDQGTPLPPVVLGESLEPLAVYERGDSGLSPDPVLVLHVRFAMIRNGPSARTWTVTLAAPDESSSAMAALRDGHRFAIRFEGNDYLLGLSYGADYDRTAVDFFTMLPDSQTAMRLAESVTNSIAYGPPMGGLAG